MTTQVKSRKVIAYRPDDDVSEYLDKIKAESPLASMNQIVDALVRDYMSRQGERIVKVVSVTKAVEAEGEGKSDK